MTTMCWMGIFFQAACEAPNAGETLGPRAVVNAVSKASIFLRVADVLMRSNIFLLRPPANTAILKGLLPGNRKASWSVFREHDTIVKAL
jgi:hypothetical protein